MPVKFACPHCDQMLSAQERKIGTQSRCPKCRQHFTVPDEETARLALVERKKRKEEASESSDDPFAQFVVYDDTELVYESEFDDYDPGAEIDFRKVAVPRAVIYGQGVLLAVVALVAFSLGVAFGWGTRGTGGEAAAVDQPCRVAGRLLLRQGNDSRPAADCVVIIVPVERRPDQKVPYEGLRPEESPLEPEHPTVRQIRNIDGDYTRSAADGSFQLQVPRHGRYYLLALSAERRPANQLPARDDVAQLARYFTSGFDLLGESRYSWQEARLRGDRENWDIVLE